MTSRQAVSCRSMTFAFNELGATLLLLALFFSGFTLFTHLSWFKVMDTVGAFTLNSLDWLRFRITDLFERLRGRRELAQREQQSGLSDSKRSSPNVNHRASNR